MAFGARRLAGATGHRGASGWPKRDEEAQVVSVTRSQPRGLSAGAGGEPRSGDGGGSHGDKEPRPSSGKVGGSTG